MKVRGESGATIVFFGASLAFRTSVRRGELNLAVTCNRKFWDYWRVGVTLGRDECLCYQLGVIHESNLLLQGNVAVGSSAVVWERAQMISRNEGAEARAIRRVALARVGSLEVCCSAHSTRGRELMLGSHFGYHFVTVRLGNLSILGILFLRLTHVSRFPGLWCLAMSCFFSLFTLAKIQASVDLCLINVI